MLLESTSGRVRILVLAVCVTVLTVGGFYVRRSASAWSEAAAARTAVAVILAAIEAEEAPAASPSEVGREATAEEAVEIDKAVQAYLRALGDSDLEAAWEMIHPDSRGGLDFNTWQQTQAEAMQAERWYQGDLDAIQLLILGNNFELGEVITGAGRGWARIVMALEIPGTLTLRSSPGGWTIDLTRTRDCEAAAVVERQLRSFRNRKDSLETLLMAMMTQETEYVPISITDLVGLPMAEIKCDTNSRRVDGEIVTVGLTGSARLHVAMPLAYGDRGWSIAWCQEPRIIKPDDELAEVTDMGPSSGGGRGTHESCQSNLKQLALAALMYAQDYDERMPIADRWSWALHPYCRNTAIHHCPADEEAYSYAMNYKLSRQSLSKVMSPGETILLFESDLGVPNAWDGDDYPGTSLCNPPRHNEGNNYAFVDGHVMWSRPDNPSVAPDAYRLAREGPPGSLMMEQAGYPVEEVPREAPPPEEEGPPAPPQALGRQP